MCCTVYYLQTGEDGKQVVEGEHITVNSHQAQQPGGTDEQQQQDRHAQSRATKRHTDDYKEPVDSAREELNRKSSLNSEI